jgi:hypothetical protein
MPVVAIPSLSFQSLELGVDQLASIDACPSVIPKPLPFWCFAFDTALRSCHVVSVRLPTAASGVGHEPQPLPDVRRADTASSKYRRPRGVTLPLQVSTNSVEPAPSNSRRNLLSKNDCRSALADETEPMRP